jgi:hypothetical protein
MRHACATALSVLHASPNPHRQLAWWMQWTQHKQQPTTATTQQQEQPVTLALSLELLSQVGHEALLHVLSCTKEHMGSEPAASWQLLGKLSTCTETALAQQLRPQVAS